MDSASVEMTEKVINLERGGKRCVIRWGEKGGEREGRGGREKMGDKKGGRGGAESLGAVRTGQIEQRVNRVKVERREGFRIVEEAVGTCGKRAWGGGRSRSRS